MRFVALVCILPGWPAAAARLDAGPGGAYPSLGAALSAAKAGDTVDLRPGAYRETGLRVDKRLCLRSGGGATLDGGDRPADILTLAADSCSVSGLAFRNVGVSFMRENAALRVEGVRGCRIDSCGFDRTFFGIYLAHASECAVRGNRLRGRPGAEATTGNGIHMWYCDHMLIAGNRCEGHRDGIYLEFTSDSRVEGNASRGNLRYGLHFMFSHHDAYRGNAFEANGSGVAVMYSHDIDMRGNLFRDNWGAAAYGLLLKEISRGQVADNRFERNTVGILLEGTEDMDFSGNSLRENGWALRLLGSGSGNAFRGNRFVANTFDVGCGSARGSAEFDGNYWSKYRGYDLDRDGIGDVPYRPVELFAYVLERVPPAMALLRSHFTMVLDALEAQFPVFTPAGVQDRRPRMRPPAAGDAGLVNAGVTPGEGA